MSEPGKLPIRRFQFFPLVSILQRLSPDRAPVGYLGGRGQEIGEELLRFRPSLGLAFPVREIERVEHLSEVPGVRDDRWRVEVNFGGLYGPDTPLPAHYTESMLPDLGEEPDDGKEAVRDFLDVFHHRLYSLLFRTWSKYRYHATFKADGSDAVSSSLLSLVGLGTDGLAYGGGLDGVFGAVRMLRYGGLSSQRPRSAAVLRGILADNFPGVPVRIQQFVLRLVDVPPASRTYLGGKRSDAEGPAVAARRLGRDTVVGATTRDRSSKVRVVMGPVGLQRLHELLPGTDDRRALDELCWRVLPRHMEHDVEVIVRGKEVPALRLPESGEEVGGGGGPCLGVARLGWTSWVTSGPSDDKRILFRARPAVTTGLPA